MEAWNFRSIVTKQEIQPYVDGNDICHSSKGCYACAELGEESCTRNLLFLKKN